MPVIISAGKKKYVTPKLVSKTEGVSDLCSSHEVMRLSTATPTQFNMATLFPV